MTCQTATTLLAAQTAVPSGHTLHAWAVVMHGEASHAHSLRRRHHPAARVSWRCHSGALSGRGGREQRRITGLSGRVCFVWVRARYVGPRGTSPEVYGDVTGPPQVLIILKMITAGKGLTRARARASSRGTRASLRVQRDDPERCGAGTAARGGRAPSSDKCLATDVHRSMN